ncbi:DUF6461 domain-containing protein [Nocardia sp. NPDC127579]|uniref:DUF6461 domain-containing protein n=1 Tax=Nocardia sp. NPDC127579 TaxID=3345402 RepID=UPI003644939E
MSENPTAADYTWVEEQYPHLMEAYCLTLVRGITPAALLSELDAMPAPTLRGVAALREPSYDAWDDYAGDKLFVGVTAVGEWALMVEFNGYIGVSGAVAQPLSRGRTVVSHFRNVNAVDHFYCYENGTLRVHFEPLFPNGRDGSHPDELVPQMLESGFDLSDSDDRDYEAHTEATFALAHRVSGVAVTPDLFAAAEFTCGIAPLPHG